MNLSICPFDERDVRRFVAHATGLALREQGASDPGVSVRLPVRRGGSQPAHGVFYRPESRPDWLLFTSDSADGWDSLLRGIEQQAATPGPTALRTMFRVMQSELLLELSVVRAGQPQRLIRLMDDGRARLDWFELGHPLPFEDTARHAARRRRDRMDVALMCRYAQALGLDGLGERDFRTGLPHLCVNQVWASAGA